VAFCCTINVTFSMFMGAGMASIRAARSPYGVHSGMVVGAVWVVCYTALISGSVSLFSVAGAGRASGC
jgi:uncharacterized membrane protein